jgi:mitochondrial GTPase 1
MHRAARSLPALLRQAERETGKRPLIVEVRDARLCLTSINPFFERLLKESDMSRSRSKGKGKQRATEEEDDKGAGPTRLIVYTKGDLIDKGYHQAIKNALKKHAPSSGEEIFFIDTRNDGDVRKIYTWVNGALHNI